MSKRDRKWLAFFAGCIGFNIPMMFVNIGEVIEDGGWWSGFCLAGNILALVLAAVFVWYYINKEPAP